MRTGRRIGVLLGGLSSERDLSLRTGEAVYAALVERGHDAVRIFVDRDLDLALRAERIEVAFLALHGRYGEDGCVQGLLELLGIPYTGSSVLSSALAMDKLKAKELFRLHNLPTPAYYVHRRGEQSAAEQHGSFGFPAVVKPRAEGSSLGVRLAEDADELEAAVEDALRFDDDVLVERFIEGAEVHVALIGDRPLGAAEVVPERAIFDYAARHSGSSVFLPPRLSAERLRGVCTLAERAARALECTGLVEVDVLVSERGNEYLIEVDTQPSLAPHGLLPKIARAAGVELGALVETLLDDAQLHAGGRAGGRRSRRVDDGAPGVERRAVGSEPH
ncbi:MAG TPA: D-alanine--D-alanine ligase [Polyangia bacterium]|nr:D-alanine--D-alanine ligase [Polyangia bacterium]